jgi:hypothetical protein
VSTIEITRAESPAEREEWDRRIEEGDGLLFSRASWAEMLASAASSRWSLRLCRRGEVLVGGALLLDENGWGALREAGSAAPLFSLHVFFREEVSSTRRIPQGVEVLSAIARALEEDEPDLACDTPPDLLDLRPLSWSGWRVEPRFGFSLPLPSEPPEQPVRLEEARPSSGDRLSASSIERGIGSHYAFSLPTGERGRLLVLRDGTRLYPLLLESGPKRPGSRAMISLASSVGSLPEAGGRRGAVFFGPAWEEWFGHEVIRPLLLVPTARAVRRAGRP